GYEIGTTNRHRVVIVDAPEGGPRAELIAAEVMHDDGYGAGRDSEKGSVIAQTELTAGSLRLRPMVTGYWATFGEPGVVPIEDIRRGYFERTSAPAGDLDGRSRRMLAALGGTYQR